MSSYYPTDSSLMSKRALVFLIIVVIHVLAIWAFASGLARSGAKYLQTILQTNIIQAEKPKELPPPPPQADLKIRPPVQVIAPAFAINIPAEPPPIQQVTTKPPPPPVVKAIVVPPTPPVPAKVTYAPDPADYYPDSSRRAGEEGRALVKVCVDPRGKIGVVEISATSGHADLDAAAVRYAHAMRFKPATQNGKPVDTCPSLPVKFQLNGG
jgi:periplasmic protein TonB